MANYTDKDTVENYLKRSLTTKEEALLTVVGDAVKIWIDNQVNSTFGEVDETTRYFDGGHKIIYIDPCYDISAVKSVDDVESVNYTYSLNEDFEARPRNETVKRWIEKRGNAFPKGVANIAVTAHFSLGELPDDIQYIASVMTGGIFVEGKEGKKIKESIEGYSYELGSSLDNGDLSKSKEVIQSVLLKYTRKEPIFL